MSSKLEDGWPSATNTHYNIPSLGTIPYFKFLKHKSFFPNIHHSSQSNPKKNGNQSPNNHSPVPIPHSTYKTPLSASSLSQTNTNAIPCPRIACRSILYLSKRDPVQPLKSNIIFDSP